MRQISAGVIRPWDEALEIAKEEAFEEMVYDPETGEVYPVCAHAP